jgi:hypothetical protein
VGPAQYHWHDRRRQRARKLGAGRCRYHRIRSYLLLLPHSPSVALPQWKLFPVHPPRRSDTGCSKCYLLLFKKRRLMFAYRALYFPWSSYVWLSEYQASLILLDLPPFQTAPVLLPYSKQRPHAIRLQLGSLATWRTTRGGAIPWPSRSPNRLTRMLPLLWSQQNRTILVTGQITVASKRHRLHLLYLLL